MKRAPIINRTVGAPHRPSNKLLIQALDAARERVRLDRDCFICWSLDHAACRCPKLWPAVRYLKWFIMRMLKHDGVYYNTVGSYLRARFDEYYDYDRKQVRLDWIDWMKEQLS